MSAVVDIAPKPKLLSRMADRFGVDADKMMGTLKATAFKGDVTNEQMMSLLIVAEQYGLNPWTKEIYAFPDKGGIVPVVGVDGWSRIINEHKEFDGMDFSEADDGSWIQCTIHRKDRAHPTSVKEWLVECKRGTGPWQSHPRRMLRHKAMIQCARIAFGFAGIFDQDEAERIVDVTPGTKVDPRGDLSQVDPELAMKHYSTIVDVLNQDKDENAIAADLREVADELCRFPDLYSVIQDKLAKEGVISKANWKKYLKIGLDQERDHG